MSLFSSWENTVCSALDLCFGTVDLLDSTERIICFSTSWRISKTWLQSQRINLLHKAWYLGPQHHAATEPHLHCHHACQRPRVDFISPRRVLPSGAQQPQHSSIHETHRKARLKPCKAINLANPKTCTEKIFTV